jgi:protein-disulfide isomerase
MRLRLEQSATVILVLAALSIAAVAVRRELIGQGLIRSSQGASLGPPEFVPDWLDLTSSGRWLGDSNAPVRIVEFADFECPFCAAFEASYFNLKRELGNDVALLFVHYPLQGHRFARLAAKAAECGAIQGGFDAVHDALFAKQDSFGLRPWTEFAVDAGLPDQDAFAKCLSGPDTLSLISRGVAAGVKLRIRGTPTILINGWRLPDVPLDTLPATVRDVLRRAGR